MPYIRYMSTVFCSIEQPALSNKTVRMLKDTKHATLSQDDTLVMQDEFSMMWHNKTYSFGRRYMCKVHVFQGEWISLSHRADSVLICEFMKEKDETSVHEEEIGLDSVISFSSQCSHVIAKINFQLYALYRKFFIFYCYKKASMKENCCLSFFSLFQIQI